MRSTQKQKIAPVATALVILAFYFVGPKGLFFGSLAYVIVGLILLAADGRKYGDGMLEYLRALALLTQGLRSWAGLLLTLVFMVAIFGWFADGVATHEGYMACGAIFLAGGTTVWAAWLAPQRRKDLPTTRMVSGLSLINKDGIAQLEKYATLEELERAIAQGDEVGKNNFIPIIATIAKYDDLKTVWLILFKGTLKDDVNFDHVKNVILRLFPNKFDSGDIIRVDLSAIPNWDANAIYSELRERLQKEESGHAKPEAEGNTVFAITSGTAALTAALSVLALQGNAKPVYFRKDDSEGASLAERVVDFEDWDIIRFKHLVREVMDALGDV